MQIVIDIDDNLYTRLFDNSKIDAVDMLKACVAIRKGKAIPEGHGRIGDLDAVMSDISTSINEMTNIGVAVDGDYLWAKLNDAIDDAPIIIETDKVESKE